jgi:hypothetical protein
MRVISVSGVRHRAVVPIDARRRQVPETGEANPRLGRPRNGDEARETAERRGLVAGRDDGQQPRAHELPPQWITTS